MNLMNFLDRKYFAYGDCPECGGKLFPFGDTIIIKDKHLMQGGRNVKCKECKEIFGWFEDPNIVNF
jgi:DNA-directed RNA polymerase subunit RPC12/RpoP